VVAARPEPVIDIRRPFTRGDAVRAGISPKVLRTSLFRRVFRGVFISADVPDSPFVRAEAALTLHPPTAFASHTTAALLYDLPVPVDARVHVTVPTDRDRRSRPEIRNHVTNKLPRVAMWRGLRVSHPFRMFVELASMLSLVDLVVVGDALVKLFKVKAARLVEECRASTAHHAATALRAARFVRDGVDSPMESRLRMLIVLAGLPEPDVNHKIRDERGRLLRRLDLSYPALRLIVEYDGRQHIEREESWDSDLARREEFDDEGWRILVVTAKGIYRQPERTLGRVLRALKARGCRDLPQRLSDEWRAHFPARG
jgi:very-short-patch-repair endonuclease